MINKQRLKRIAARKRVLVHNKSRMDHAFEGRTGTYIETVSNGYLRLHLDGEQPTQTVLVHPESVEFR